SRAPNRRSSWTSSARVLLRPMLPGSSPGSGTASRAEARGRAGHRAREDAVPRAAYPRAPATRRRGRLASIGELERAKDGGMQGRVQPPRVRLSGLISGSNIPHRGRARGVIVTPATCKHSSMSVGQADSRYMSLAWLVLALALALRLVFFVGFGLGDDSNESIAVDIFARTLRLDPGNFMDYRVMNIVPRGLVYRFFGPSELAFILPILVMALGTHGASIVFARELLGTRAAFFTSVAFLVTPYETLASTANVPDYALAFFGVVVAWAALRGYRRGSPGYMAVAACCIGLAFLNRMAAILLLPPFAVATLGTLRLWRCWLSSWGTLVGIFALFCVADFYYSGSPYRWVWFNSAGGVGGHDVTDILGYVLMIYPRYLFGQDDFLNRMFGLT